MNLQETYNKYKSTLFGFDSKYLIELRNELINNFDLNPKKLKNNESTKHFDTKILIDFEYNPLSSKYFHPDIISNNDLKYNISNKKQSILENLKKYENAFENDYIVNFNTILQNSGFILEIEKDQKGKLFINNKINENCSVFTKNFIKVDSNNDIQIIERFNNSQISNMNVINYFDIKENSKIYHLIIEENNKEADMQLTNYINCSENSEYTQIIFNVSDSSVRNHTYANLLDKNSRADLQGIFLANGTQIIDNKTVVNHYSPHCSSDQKYKGILTDQSKASYLSKTFVDNKAQKTEAYQLSKGILLSEDSYFHSKPELKIYADDVKCSHGSTIGPFDKNILYYCRSRGIPKDVSTSLLINSFFSDILNNISEKESITLINGLIHKWLNNNNY